MHIHLNAARPPASQPARQQPSIITRLVWSFLILATRIAADKHGGLVLFGGWQSMQPYPPGSASFLSRLVVVAAIASAAAHTSAGGWLIEVRALQAERKNYFFFNEYSWIFGQNKPKVRKRKATFRLQCVARCNCLFVRAAFRLWYNIFALAKKFTFHVVSH